MYSFTTKFVLGSKTENLTQTQSYPSLTFVCNARIPLKYYKMKESGCTIKLVICNEIENLTLIGTYHSLTFEGNTHIFPKSTTKYCTWAKGSV